MELSMWIFIVFVVLFVSKLKFLRRPRNSRQFRENGGKLVPIVSCALPVFGHALWITFFPRRFMQFCYKSYGDIFKIRILSSTVAVVCNKELVVEIYKSAESQLSLYNHLEHIFIGEANGVKISIRTAIIKKATVRMGNAEIATKIQKCVLQFIGRIADNFTNSTAHDVENTKMIDLKDELFRFVIRTTSSCLLGVEFTEQMVQEFKDFNNLQNLAISATRVLPIKVAKLIFAKRLTKEKSKIWDAFKKQIRHYRENSSFRDSSILRVAVDSTIENTGRHLDENEICFILMGLLFASTGNTTLCLLHTILELSNHPKCLELALQEILENSRNNDVQKTLNSNYLQGCILDAARLNTNIILAERSPDQKNYIGDYYVGECDLVAIAGTLNHVDGTAKTVFSSPKQYNPERYLQNERLENRVISWGGGVHACPGKLFAIAMAKSLVAAFFRSYKINIGQTNISSPNFMNHSAFVDLNVHAAIEKRDLGTI